MASPARIPLDIVLATLSAAAEETRLRLVALLAEAELTVTELVAILGQSQPRVSRHLKLLVDAQVVERHREGAWAFFLLADRGPSARIARDLVARFDPEDPILAADRSRLAEVRAQRAAQAARYFAAQAPDWDRLRSLHVPEARVEAAVLALAGEAPLGAVLDLGTGTGRMLELLSPRADRVVGVDQSPAMLSVARARIEEAGLRNAQLRQGDLYALPTEPNGYDLVVIHQVLHYLDDPSRAVREAARALRAGGRLLVVDFAPHDHEFLRTDQAHRRLGFAAADIENAMRDAGLVPQAHDALRPAEGEAGTLTVSLWLARDPRRVYDLPLSTPEREVA